MGAKLNANSSRTLGAFSIWAIGVGLVISGESFGWNLGWGIVGPVGFFVPVCLVAIMYYALIQCKIELACVYPEADGAHIYVKNAFGNHTGNFIALAILIEFLFVTPSVAHTIGEYLGFLNNAMELTNWIATIFVAAFCLLALFNLNIGIYFVIVLTFFAIFELLIYSGAVATNFNSINLVSTQYDKYDLASIVKALPYAIWMYLAIEGISLNARSIKADNFRKHISWGYNAAFWTLTALVSCVLILAGGSLNWNNETWAMVTADNHPLPASMALVLTKGNVLVRLFTFLGLFGLIASLQGVVLASSTQLELVLQMFKLKVKNIKIVSIAIVFFVSVSAIWASSTAFMIELTVFGGVCMYFMVSLSLIKARKNSLLTKPIAYEGLSNDEDIQYFHHNFSELKSTIFSYIAVIFSFLAIIVSIYLQPLMFLFFIGLAGIFVLVNKSRK